MSWTTLPGQKTATSPLGRDAALTGMPIHLPELIASQFEPAYAARCAVYSAKAAADAKRCIKNALEAQINGEGYSIVELLGICVKANEWLQNELMKEYPLGVFAERRSV